MRGLLVTRAVDQSWMAVRAALNVSSLNQVLGDGVRSAELIDLVPGTEANPEEQTIQRDREQKVRDLLVALPMSTLELYVIKMRYGFEEFVNGQFCPTVEQLAVVLGCSKANIHQAEKRGLRWLRKALEEERGKEFGWV